MDQESFESSIKSKLEGKSVKAPSSIWTGISGSLNDQAIVHLQASQRRYRWVAVAAVLIALFSFAFNAYDFKAADPNARESFVASSSYNALLPSNSEHFRFFDPPISSPQISNSQIAWSRVLFIEDKEEKETTPAQLVDDLPVLTFAKEETLEILGRKPAVDKAMIVSEDFYPYYVAQGRSQKRRSTKSTFWAGIEAGAGSFDPEFNGADPIAANVNLDAVAQNIGQSRFANPSTTAMQDGMNEGVVTSLGVDFGVKMGKKWTLESGLQYANVQNQASASVNVSDIYTIRSERVFASQGDLNNPGVESGRQTQITENFEHDVNLDNNFRFTSIPLKAGYFLVDNKLSLRLNAGLSANYLVGNILTDPSGQLESYDQSGAYNSWSFDGLTGFELGYSVFENFNLTFEPNYRQSITPLSNSLTTRSGFMVQTGLRYTIK